MTDVNYNVVNFVEPKFNSISDHRYKLMFKTNDKQDLVISVAGTNFDSCSIR